MVRTLYFDESGNTGPNLISSQQPIYTLASHDASNSVSKEILINVFGKLPERELKTSRLKKTKIGQTRIVQIISALDTVGANRRGYVADKAFCLSTKLFDTFVETGLHMAGKNAYEGHNNIIASQAVHLALLQTLGQEGLVQFHIGYEGMVRSGNPDTYKAFWHYFETQLIPKAKGQPKGVLEFVLTYGQVEIDYEADYIKDSLDIVQSLFMSELISWTRDDKRRVKVCHDAQTKIAAFRSTYDMLRTGDGFETIVGYGDQRDFGIPLPLEPLEIGDSKEIHALQIADVLAGAYTELGKAIVGYDHDEKFVDNLKKIGFDSVQDNIFFDPSWRPPTNKNGKSPDIDPISFGIEKGFGKK